MHGLIYVAKLKCGFECNQTLFSSCLCQATTTTKIFIKIALMIIFYFIFIQTK